MVAILVLSIALLGIAGLMSASLRFAQGSWARASVSSALSDLADRVRSNPGATPVAYAASAPYVDQQVTSYALPFTTDCLAATCAAASDLAAFQLEQWRLEVKRTLPSSAIWVSGQRSTGYVATVMWFDKTFLKADGKTPEASPTCGSGTPTGLAQRSCCPSGATVPDGVRCTNMTIVP